MSEKWIVRLCRFWPIRALNLIFHWYVFYLRGNPYKSATIYIISDVTCWDFFHYMWKEDRKLVKRAGNDPNKVKWKRGSISDAC